MRVLLLSAVVCLAACGVDLDGSRGIDDGLTHVAADGGSAGGMGGMGGMGGGSAGGGQGGGSAGGGQGGGSAGGGQGGGSAGSTECTTPRPTSLCPVVNTPAWECRNGHWECPETPLVLSFDRRPVRFVSGEARFDLSGTGAAVSSDWPSTQTPWLALDRNHNGQIDDATELFGSAVRLAHGERATNGFEALAELDDNRDGQIDANDRRFGDLLLWADRDGDKKTGRGELRKASAVVSISLTWRVVPACDARGNCSVERARFTWADARGALHVGEVVDVHLPVR